MESFARLRPLDPFPYTPLKSTFPTANARLICSSLTVVMLGFSRNQSADKRIQFHRRNYKIPFRKQGTGTWRNSIVRSEIAATTGFPDASAYPATESRVGSRVRAICFYFVTAAAAIVLVWAMVVMHPLVMLFDRHRRRAQHFIAKLWASLTVTPFYRIHIEGLENLPSQDKPAVYVSNHQSFLDIYTLLTLGSNFKFISKTSIFLFPIIGWGMLFMGVIPLRRMDSRSQLDCLKRCIELVRKGASVFFFPEGTRSKDGKLGAFKKGAFSVAAKTGVPVVPITLMGTGSLMPTGMEGYLNSGSVRVVIHKPIEGSDVDKLCNEARDAIGSLLPPDN